MSLNQRVNTTLTSLAIRTVQSPLTGQLLLLGLLVTLAVAAALIARHPLAYIPMPACGSGSGGGGGC